MRPNVGVVCFAGIRLSLSEGSFLFPSDKYQILLEVPKQK